MNASPVCDKKAHPDGNSLPIDRRGSANSKERSGNVIQKSARSQIRVRTSADKHVKKQLMA